MILPHIVSILYFAKNSFDDDGNLYSLGGFFLLLGLCIYISYFLLFRTEKLINFFLLDKGFDEKLFELNISSEAVYIIAIVVTGMFLIITEIPVFCQVFFNFLKGADLDLEMIVQLFLL